MKNTGKLTILMIAVVAMGVFSLPSVLSVGVGQHKFNNGSQVQCGKCHAGTNDAVFKELSASGVVQYSNYGNQGGRIHNGSGFWLAGSYQCVNCHQISQESQTTRANHTGIQQKVVCGRCHGAEYNELTTDLGANTDAHRQFAINTSAGTQGTYACIGCHTAVTVTGSPSYLYSANVTVAGLTIGNGPVTPT